METKEQSFRKELIALFDRYQVTLDRSDNYDSNENYLGTEYYFESPLFETTIHIDDI